MGDGGIVAFRYHNIGTTVLVVGNASIDLLCKYYIGDVSLAALQCKAMRARHSIVAHCTRTTIVSIESIHHLRSVRHVC